MAWLFIEEKFGPLLVVVSLNFFRPQRWVCGSVNVWFEDTQSICTGFQIAGICFGNGTEVPSSYT